MLARAHALVIAMAAAGACHHGDHVEGITSTGGEGRPCVITDADGSTTTDEPIDGTFAWILAIGVIVELDVELGDDGTMRAAFDASGVALDWDIHTHDGHDVIVLASGHDALGTAELVAPAPGLYSFTWRNPGPGDTTLCVELTLTGAAALPSR